MNKQSVKNTVLSAESVSIKAKKPLKSLYKGVKLPIFKTLVGSLLYLVGTLVIATQADALAAITVGNIQDLSPIFVYALMCVIGYVFFYASVIADLGFVDLAARIRKKIWKKVMNLPLSYFDKENSNRVLSRITADPEYSFLPFKLLQLAFTLIAFLLIVLVGDAAIQEAALVLIIGFIVTMVIMFIAARFSERGAMYVAGKLAAFTSYLAERFGHIRFIKAMNSEEKENTASLKYIEERYEADKYNAFAQTMVTFGQTFVTFALFTAAFFVGIFLIKGGRVTQTAKIVAFYAYGGNMVTVFQFFTQIPSIFATTKGGSKKIVQILEEEEEKVDLGSAEVPPAGDLRLENVSFGYGEREVVHGINAIIPKGKITAIVGPNGSGKTTFTRLIERLYPDYNGAIYMGEEAVGAAAAAGAATAVGAAGSAEAAPATNPVSLRAWRDRFGLVSQNATLFEGTIRDNICYGVKEVSEEQLESVIRLSCLEDVIASHEGGLEFNVGANGEKLSGGEQQRVAIARAMLKNPDYLILDEATANLDPMTEDKIRKSVSALTQGRTTIMVAHSFRAVQNADNVIVMNQGVIEDAGTIEELKARNGYFKAFAEAAEA